MSSAMGPHCQLSERNLLSWQQQGFGGDVHGIPLAINSIECNLTSPLKALPDYKRYPVETPNPLPNTPLLGVLTRITFVRFHKIIRFLSFPCARFPYHPSIPAISPHILSCHPTSSSPDSLLSSQPQCAHEILFPGEICISQAAPLYLTSLDL